MTTFGTLFFTLILLYLTAKVYLNFRQRHAVRAHANAVPEDFSAHVSLDAHQKAAHYTQDKLKLGTVALGLEIIVLVFWLYGGGFVWLDGLIQKLEFSSIWTGVVFLMGFLLLNQLIELPISYYSTFHLEARHGFNNSTLSIFIADLFKGFILMGVLGAPLLYAVLYFMENSGSLWWLWVWLLWSGFTFTMMWAYPRFIAPLFNKFTPLEDGEMKSRIENLLKRTGFASDGVFVMDGSKRSSHGNAYFTGFGKNKRIVFFDTLLKQLSPVQVEAVLAHELGHFHHKHINKGLILSLLVSLGLLFVLGFISQQAWFFESFGVNDSAYMTLAIFLVVMSVIGFFSSPVFNLFSRKHEYEADAFAAKHTSAQDLIDALLMLYKENASTLTPDSLYTFVYASHPKASERISKLNRY